MTVLRHVLAWLFVLAGLASVVRAVNSTGAARWWWIAGITLCSWSASWVERSRVFNADDEEEAYDEHLEAAPDPPASQVPARRGPRQWR